MISSDITYSLKTYEQSLNNTDKKKNFKKGAEADETNTTKNQEKFEAMKRKAKNILFAMIAVIIAAAVRLLRLNSM